jgi:hypothetical protein
MFFIPDVDKKFGLEINLGEFCLKVDMKTDFMRVKIKTSRGIRKLSQFNFESTCMRVMVSC